MKKEEEEEEERAEALDLINLYEGKNSGRCQEAACKG